MMRSVIIVRTYRSCAFGGISKLLLLLLLLLLYLPHLMTP